MIFLLSVGTIDEGNELIGIIDTDLDRRVINNEWTGYLQRCFDIPKYPQEITTFIEELKHQHPGKKVQYVIYDEIAPRI